MRYAPVDNPHRRACRSQKAPLYALSAAADVSIDTDSGGVEVERSSFFGRIGEGGGRIVIAK